MNDKNSIFSFVLLYDFKYVLNSMDFHRSTSIVCNILSF